MMKRIGIILMSAALLGFGCQQARITRTDRCGIYRPPDGAIPLDGQPYAILHHQGRLYVTSFHDRKLWVIDAASGKELGRFDNFDHYTATFDEMDQEGKIVGQRTEKRQACAGEMAIAGSKLFVEQIFCDSLLVFDANTLHPIGRVNTGQDGKMVTSPDGSELYFARNDETGFCIINPNTYQKRDIPYPKGGRGIGAIAISPDGKRLYLGIQQAARDAGADAPSKAAGPENPLKRTCTGSFLAIYDLVGQEYTALKSIGDTVMVCGDDASIPAGFAFSADKRSLYIAMRQCMAGVHVFDLVTNELRKPITFASMHEVFPWPACSSIACRDGKIFVIIGSNYELAILDDRTHRTLQIIPLGGYGKDQPGPLALSADRVFVCHSGLRRLFFVDLGSSSRRPLN